MFWGIFRIYSITTVVKTRDRHMMRVLDKEGNKVKEATLEVFKDETTQVLSHAGGCPKFEEEHKAEFNIGTEEEPYWYTLENLLEYARCSMAVDREDSNE